MATEERAIGAGDVAHVQPPPIATTLGVLAVAEPALARLLTYKLPLARAHQLAMLARAVRLELEFYTVTRESLAKELGVRDGLMWKIPPDRLEDWAARIGELHAIAVSLAVTPIDISDWNLEITGEDLIALGPLLVTPCVK